MSEINVKLEMAQKPTVRLLKYALQAMILLPVLAGVVIYQLWIAPPTATETTTAAAPTVISSATLKERFGVQMRLLGVTAAGGMIDLRYKVIDKEKAAFLVGEGSAPPQLIAEESGVTLSLDESTHGMKHNTRLENGGIYFHFFPNRQNTIKPGSLVTVVFGSVRLEPMPAQ